MEYPFTYCQHPQRIKNSYTGEELVVPCGHCTACSMNKSARLAFQCDCEAKVSKYVIFVTLTYANTYIPRMRAFEKGSTPDGFGKYYDLFDVTTPRSRYDTCMSYIGRARYSVDLYKALQKKCHLFGDIPYLRKRDLQLFIKNLRSYLPEYEIRYFASGEYGPETFRPHFHLLLYVNDSELCTASDYCTMSEFPQWTWPKCKNRVIRATDKISLLEYYIRKTWSYGIVDTELIADGAPSSYVASYVNGSQPLPSFLTLPTSKCFSVHSRFLGGKIFRKELVSVLSTPVEKFIKGSLELSSRVRDYSLRYQNYRAYYPRCKGFAGKDSYSRLQSYQCYDTAKSFFKVDSLMDLSRSLSEVLYMYRYFKSAKHCVEVGLTFYQIYSKELISLVDLLYPFRDLPDDVILTSDDWDKITMNIYTQLLVSRIFCDNVRILRWTPWLYLQKIEEFYSQLDYLHLKDFFESQSKYFLKDFADEGDLVYFYNNSDYDVEEFKNSFAYRAFNCNVKTLAKQFMKHKIQNDKNNMFVYG